MLRTGKDHLESLRDGRVIYIGSERVDDVTRHPAFRNAATTVAALSLTRAPRPSRSNRRRPSSASSFRIWPLKVGWLTLHAAAARPKWP